MVIVRSTGRPADWKVKNRITSTKRKVNILITRLSVANESFKSLQLVEPPTRIILPVP